MPFYLPNHNFLISFSSADLGPPVVTTLEIYVMQSYNTYRDIVSRYCIVFIGEIGDWVEEGSPETCKYEVSQWPFMQSVIKSADATNTIQQMWIKKQNWTCIFRG